MSTTETHAHNTQLSHLVSQSSAKLMVGVHMIIKTMAAKISEKKGGSGYRNSFILVSLDELTQSMCHDCHGQIPWDWKLLCRFGSNCH